jgi:hypothetical protein
MYIYYIIVSVGLTKTLATAPAPATAATRAPVARPAPARPSPDTAGAEGTLTAATAQPQHNEQTVSKLKWSDRAGRTAMGATRQAVSHQGRKLQKGCVGMSHVGVGRASDKAFSMLRLVS